MAHTLAYVRQLTIPPAKWDDANDDGAQSRFGSAIAISATLVIAGCPQKYHNGNYYGAVYVYDWNGNYIQELLPEAVDMVAWMGFGTSVALSGNWLVVGAPWTVTGIVYFYEWTGAAFVLRQRVVGSTSAANDEFGNHVAIKGAVAIVGAPWDDDSALNAGAVFVFREAGGVWAEDQIIQPPLVQASQYFGGKLALDETGAILAVSAPGVDGPIANEGRVYIYEDSGGTFGHVKDCVFAELGGAAGDVGMGTSLAITGDALYVGCGGWEGLLPGDNNTGAIAVWEKVGGIWTYQTLLRSVPEADGGQLGDSGGSPDEMGSVAASGSLLAGGARGWWSPPFLGGWRGAAFLWRRTGVGVYELQTYVYPDVIAEFGVHIAVLESEMRLAVGGYTGHAGLGSSGDDMSGFINLYDVIDGSAAIFPIKLPACGLYIDEVRGG